VKRSALLALLLACLLVGCSALAEDWSDLYAFSTDTAIGYDQALETYAEYPFAPQGTRVEMAPADASLTGDAALAEVTSQVAREVEMLRAQDVWPTD